MLSAYEKLQIAAWKAETEAARERVHSEDAPGWITSAAYFFFSGQERLLEEAEREGCMIDAQIAHCRTLWVLGEEERAAVLDKTTDEYLGLTVTA